MGNRDDEYDYLFKGNARVSVLPAGHLRGSGPHGLLAAGEERGAG